MSEQETRLQDTNSDLRAAIQSLLQEDLSDQDLRDRLRTLAGAPQGATAQPTTDDATDHPGYQ